MFYIKQLNVDRFQLQFKHFNKILESRKYLPVEALLKQVANE